MRPSFSLGVALVTVSSWCLGVLAIGARRAEACSPPETPPGYATLGATVPADGAAQVPLDGAVLVDLHMEGGGPFEPSITVTAVATRAPVSGRTTSYAWDQTFAVWRPDQPLAPRTRYSVQASVSSPAPRPAGAQGPAQLTFSFTTGDQPLPPLALAGRLEARLEPEERPDYSTCNAGLCTCTPTARIRGMAARMKLPAVSGGQTDRPYRALVMVTRESPHDFGAGGKVAPGVANGVASLRPGVAADLVVGYLDQETAYAPCFALQVTDIAGRQLVGEPLCLTTPVPPPQKLPGSATMPDGSAAMEAGTGAGVPDAGAGAMASASEGGCSVGGGRAGLLPAVLAAAAVLLARRRRRQGEPDQSRP